MIPDNVKDCMANSVLLAAASRDDEFQPCTTRVFGVRVDSDQTTVTFYIAQPHSEQLIANFESNGRVALTMDNPIGNESYQLKGRFISWRSNNKQDDEFLDRYQARIYDFATNQMGFSEDFLSTFNTLVYKPGLAITFEVEQVFGQAPHPDTGQLIS